MTVGRVRVSPEGIGGGIPGYEEILRLLAQSPNQDDADDAERREWFDTAPCP